MRRLEVANQQLKLTLLVLVAMVHSFYDVDADPQEENALLFKDLNEHEKEAFLKLCDGLNELSREAIYYQNDPMVCVKDEVSTNRS